jgi:Putative methyltransferase
LNLLEADKAGYTRDEADKISTPLSLLTPKGLYWAMCRLLIGMGAWFSDGMKTGMRTGFDSGSTLDYVYENRPRGFGPGGRMIDKTFLEAIGWRGIRRRKAHLEEMISLALAQLKRAKRSTNMLDIAAGHGRYVLDAVEKSRIKPDSVRLQDYSPVNVEAGNRMIAARSPGGIASFHEADAFDGEKLAKTSPKPDIAIVSGQCADQRFAWRIGQGDEARRAFALHLPAMAPSARDDRTGADLSPGRRGLGDAPAHAGGDGPAGGGGGFPEDRTAD